MKQTVYIDVLFLINFVVDSLMILSASLLLRIKVKWYRIIIASTIGGIYSCIVFFNSLNFLYGNLMTLFFYLLITYVIFGFKTFKGYIKSFFAISAIGFIYGGISFGLYLLTDAGAVMTFNNGAVYFDIPIFLFLVFTFISYVAIWGITRLLSWFNPKDVIYDVEINIDNKKIDAKGFVDTGNSLNDGITGSPVIVAEYDIIKKIIPDNIKICYEKGLELSTLTDLIINSEWDKRFRIVNYGGLSEGGMLSAFKPDNVKITAKNERKEVTDIVVAVTNKKLSDNGEYTMLLSPKMLK